MATAMLLLLLGLGTWQVRRLHWKEGVLAQIAHAEAAPAKPLQANPEPYTKVQVTGSLRNDLAASFGADVRDTPAGTVLGTQLIVPLVPDNGETILVDRGWVPNLQSTMPLKGDLTVTGYVHPGDMPGLFSATDSPATREFYTLNPAAIGAALGLHNVAPFILVALGPTPPDGYPDPAKHLPRPPNNHLSYAITWYGLAAALVVIFVVWARKALTA
jgi:surfeit locus 1 family protein